MGHACHSPHTVTQTGKDTFSFRSGKTVYSRTRSKMRAIAINFPNQAAKIPPRESHPSQQGTSAEA